MNGITFNHYIDISQISMPKYIYMDEIYDYDEILLNISQKTEGDTRKRKRSIKCDEEEEEFNKR
jgi:hypothetical protein